MTLHARTAERHLATRAIPDQDPPTLSITTLSELTRGALAETRALIFELRPGALEQEGLLTALTGSIVSHLGFSWASHEDGMYCRDDTSGHGFRRASESNATFDGACRQRLRCPVVTGVCRDS